MDWKISLDKYLTTPPDDGFDCWAEDVLGNQLSDSFYEKNEDWIDEYDGLCNKWLNKLFNKEVPASDAAKIIERAFGMYVK